MIIGTGNFEGRNGYRLEGTFTLTRLISGDISFETNDAFFFGNSSGGGTPGPGFAFFQGDPTGLETEFIEPIASATDFLRIANRPTAVMGRQRGQISKRIFNPNFDTLFLWCFVSPIVLGIGAIIPQ